MNKKLVRKYYLNEKNNAIIINFIICNIILCVLNYFMELNTLIAIIANILTIACSLGIIKENRVNIEGKVKRKLNEIYIERNNWFDEILSAKGIVFLTGESGIGKTYLLNQLIRKFNKEHISYDYEENNYFFDLDLSRMKNKDYIILDQFERALSFDNISDNIQIIRSLREKKIIISIRKEYIGDIYKLFGFSENIQFVWLDYKDEELITIKNYLQELSRLTKYNLMEHSLYSRILLDAETNNISLIQLSYLGKEIQYMEEDYVQDKLEEYEYDNDRVLSDYLNIQLNEYEYSEIAYIILYLLCQDHKGRYINDIKDFQNVTMESETILFEIIDFLCKQGWIKKLKDNENKRTELTEHYEISHDYFMFLFDKLCLENVSSDIRNNVEYYNINCQNKRGLVEERYSLKTNTNKICKDFLEINNKKYLNLGLYVMLISIFCGNIHILLKNSQDFHVYWMLAAIDLVVGESIFYVYNYYYHFISIFKTRYSIGVYVGIISCILPFFLMEYWAVSLGVEISVVGSIMGFISKNIRKEERGFFKTRCYVFIGIGLVVIVLGLFFPIYTQEKILLACPLFVLYGVYMFMGILGHINKNYILAIVGKALYKEGD